MYKELNDFSYNHFVLISVNAGGLDVPNIMDGVPDVEPSPEIEPGKYFDYHFRIVNPPGTHMYHTHFNSVT